MKNFFCFVFLCCMILGCDAVTKSKGTGEIPKNFDYGRMEGQTYKNDFFKCELTVPKDWYLMDSNEFKQMSSEGIKTLAVDEKKSKEIVKIAEVSSATLLSAFRVDPKNAIPGTSNYSITITVENLSKAPSSITSQKYLELSRENLRKMFKSTNFRPIKKKTIGSKEMSMLPVEMKIPGADITVQQEIYACISNRYGFIICISYVDQEGKKALDSVLESFKM